MVGRADTVNVCQSTAQCGTSTSNLLKHDPFRALLTGHFYLGAKDRWSLAASCTACAPCAHAQHARLRPLLPLQLPAKHNTLPAQYMCDVILAHILSAGRPGQPTWPCQIQGLHRTGPMSGARVVGLAVLLGVMYINDSLQDLQCWPCHTWQRALLASETGVASSGHINQDQESNACTWQSQYQ